VKRRTLLAAVAALAVTVAGCSSSSKSSNSTGAGKTITVGLLTDFTGLAASSGKTSALGAQAGAVVAAKDGYKIRFVIGDTQTNPSTALTAAQKLVDQDHVLAVIAVSAITFSAAPFLTAHNVPVIGAAEDSNEWITAKNMFSVYGAVDTTKVSTGLGLLFKRLGVTNVGVLGYGISPTSSESAKASAVSARHAGLTVGYENANFSFGSTNVQPVALAMKSNGVNGFTATVDPNTGLSLITAFRQIGGNLKAAVLPTGYGGDLLQAGPGALQSAQGVYFSSEFQPVEMHTPATVQFQNALKSVGVTSDPTYSEYAGYTSVLMLVDALKAAGSNPTRSSVIFALSVISNWNAGGLLGSLTLNMGQRSAQPIGTGCSYLTELHGSTFQLVAGEDPYCGTTIPGATVTAGA
jgi:ABC-type branched-subunit amino acid transport system substrate-binding protein